MGYQIKPTLFYNKIDGLLIGKWVPSNLSKFGWEYEVDISEKFKKWADDNLIVYTISSQPFGIIIDFETKSDYILFTLVWRVNTNE